MFDNRKTVEYLVNKKRFCKIVPFQMGRGKHKAHFLSLRLGKKGAGRCIYSIGIQNSETDTMFDLKKYAENMNWILVE